MKHLSLLSSPLSTPLRSLGSFMCELRMHDTRTISVNYWFKKGHPEKPVIVILPGLDEQALSWSKVIKNLESLGNENGILIINQRGQGPTRENELTRYGNTPPLFIPRQDQIHILQEILSLLEIKEIILLGHSYGGSTALGALSSFDIRTKIHSLVLLAPHVTHFERYTTNEVLRWPIHAAAWLELWNPLAYEMSTAAYLPLFFEKALRDGNLCPYTPEWDSLRRRFLTAMSLGLLHVDTQSDLGFLRHDPRPVHLIVAEKDLLIPRRAHEHLYNIIPSESRGRWIIPPGTSHRLHHKGSLEIAQLLLELKTVLLS